AALALGERLIKECSNLLVEAFLRHRIICLWIFRDFACHRSVFRFPFVAATVENFDFLVTKQAKRPKRVTSPPVRLVPVKNAGRLWCDAVPAAESRKFLRRNVIADHRVRSEAR